MTKASSKHKNKINGWLVLDKPKGLSSNQALSKIKRILKPQKAGHAGTLDPMATGVLPIALGEATKTVSFAMGGEKTYEFTIRWGWQTDTLDEEGQTIATHEKRPEKQEILAALNRFIGEIKQIPPVYSALKINGKRAYELARAGKQVEMKERTVSITDLKLIKINDEDHATFMMSCSKGTYVRSLARDLALYLGTCGSLTMLRRTKVGPFDEKHTILLDNLEKPCHSARASDQISEKLLPIMTVLDDIPALAVENQEAVRLRHGQKLSLKNRQFKPETSEQTKDIYVTENDGLVALCTIENGAIVPKRVFNL